MQTRYKCEHCNKQRKWLSFNNYKTNTVFNICHMCRELGIEAKPRVFKQKPIKSPKIVKPRRISRDKSLYSRWSTMYRRCYNINFPPYKYYGARGIRVCKEWHSFENFQDWALKSGYNKCLKIDRIDNNGDYSPVNCRWVTHKENCNNMRSSRFIEYNGQSKTISEWADKLNIPYRTFYNNLNANNFIIKDEWVIAL